MAESHRKTKRINVRREPFDVSIMRPSVYGNPYVIGRDGTRAEVVAKFRKDFEERVHDSVVFLQRICELRGKRIGCCCEADEECHGDIIADFLNQEGRYA